MHEYLLNRLYSFILLTILSIPLHAQDTNKSLLIRDVSVVDKVFPFHSLLKTLSESNEDFLENWLQQWDIVSLNGYRVTPRDTKQIKKLWPKLESGKLDLSKSPFRLMSVVNRMDLLSSENEFGEFRLVYGLYDPDSLDPEEMTIIFEFKIPNIGKDSYNYWRSQFKKLSSLSFGQEFNAQLSQIYSDIVSAKNLNQVRTNDFYLDFLWEMREFKIRNGELKQVVTAQNPDLSHNSSAEFKTWIESNESAIEQMNYIVPVKFLAPTSILETEDFVWTFDYQQKEKVRKSLSLNSCNGCHGGETRTEFTHIKVRREGVSSYISHFLKRELEVRKKSIFNNLPRPVSLPRSLVRVH